MRFLTWFYTPAVLFVAVSFLSSNQTFAQSSGKENAPGVKRALLIGINKYKAPQVSKLHGSINDIETMRQIF